MLPLEVVYYMINFAPLSFVAVSRNTHRLCQGVPLTLPYHYRTGLSGFRCVGTGKGLVLTDCVLEGTFWACNLTNCTLLYSWLKPGTYWRCRFVGCIGESNLSVAGGALEYCVLRNNRRAVTNSDKLVVENCLFTDNQLCILSLAVTTVRCCTARRNRRFGVVVGTMLLDQNKIECSLPFFLHRGGQISMAS